MNTREPAAAHTAPVHLDVGELARAMFLPALVLVLGLGLVYVLWQDAIDIARKKRQADLDVVATEIAETIDERLNGYDQLLHSLRGLFAVSDDVNRRQFKAYVDSLKLAERHIGLSGLAFVPLVSSAGKDKHIAKIRRDGVPGYVIHPDGRRASYAPVTYIEPFEGPNKRALGFDIYTESQRRAALEMARDTDKSSITSKLSLVQDNGGASQVGFLMVLPLYLPGPLPVTVQDRRSRLIGWVDAVIRAEELIHSILGKFAEQVDVEVFDESIQQMTLLYDHDKFYRADGHGESLFKTSRRIKAGGRDWVLFVSSLPPFEQQLDQTRSKFIAGSGTVVSVLLFILTGLLTHGRRQSIQSAVALRKELDARKEAEESLRLAAMVYDNTSEGVLVTDSNNRIIAVNPAFSRITGYDFEEVRGKNPKVLQSGRHGPEFYRDMWTQLDRTGTWQGEIWDRRKDGEVHAKYMTINTIYHDDGSVFRRAALFLDMSEKKKSEEYIWRQANFDSLTELPNRRMFNDRLKQDIQKSAAADLALALLFIDLDLFKDVNDTLGHHVGDELLVEAARRITSCVRSVDTVARLGGDEFTVIMPELHDINLVEQLAEKILKKLDEPYHLGADVVHISGSIGITMYPRDATEPEVLIRNADQAMYVAKSAGRQRFSYFTPELQEAAQLRLRLVTDLHGAIARNEFRVFYQPIVDLNSGRIFKAEALLRWQHPSRGWVSPGEFIPIAEDAGLVTRISDLVFRQVVQDVQQLRQTTSPEFQVSVNTSPKAFREKNGSPLAWFEQLRQMRLPGESIILEITEGLLMHAAPEVTERLQTYRNAGIQIAIDDFGTGYSSLAYLKQFDIDYLKIDKSFVRDIETDENDMALSRAIIVMAHALGLRVIAEGVETANQLQYLNEMGCDYAQGYFFAEPLPIQDVVAQIREFAVHPANLPGIKKA